MSRTIHHERTARRHGAGRLVMGLVAVVLLAAPSWAAEIVKLRVGNHPTFTRIVFELDEPAGYRVERKGDASSKELVVTLAAGSRRHSFSSRSVGIARVEVDPGTNESIARIDLRKSNLRLKEMILANPPRIVLDVMLEKPVVAVKPKPASEAKPAPVVAKTAAPTPAPVRKAAKPKPVPVRKAAKPKPVPVRKAAKPKPVPAPTAEKVEPAPSPSVTPSAATAAKPAAPRRKVAQAKAPAPVPTVEKAKAPAPVPTVEKAKAPAPAPTVEKTETPAPAPTVAKTETPAPAPTLAKTETPAPAWGADTETAAPKAGALAVAQAETGSAPGIAPSGTEMPKLEMPAATKPDSPAAEKPVAREAKPVQPAAPKSAKTSPPAGDASSSGDASSWMASPLVLGAGAGVLLCLIGFVMLMRRRRPVANDLDVTTIANAPPADPLSDSQDFGTEGAASSSAAASSISSFFDDEPEATEAVATPRVQEPQAPPSPGADVGLDDLFDSDAEPATAAAPMGDDAMNQGISDLPADPDQLGSTPPPAAAAAPAGAPDTDVLRVVHELERRMAQLEGKLDEANDAREKLERQVAAQSEELRVQRAAIARTQRALRTMSRGDEDKATEPALRESDTQAKTRVSVE